MTQESVGLKLRPMIDDDLPAVVDLQQAGAIVGLAAVFPQDRFPFPRAAIEARWRDEIRSPSVEAYVALDEREQPVGFAATSGAELLHFGTAIGTWGTGTAGDLLDLVVRRLRDVGGQPVLFVFEGNARARRFYEKHGWRPTGVTRAGTFPPYPSLLEYVLAVS